MRVLRNAREVPALWVLTTYDLNYCEQSGHHSSEILFHSKIVGAAVGITGFAALMRKEYARVEGRRPSGV